MKKISILVFSLFLIQFTTLSNSNTSDKPSRKKAKKTHIIGGTSATANFQVLLGNTQNGGGGMIIADKWILTAGHTVSISPVYVGVNSRLSLPSQLSVNQALTPSSFSNTPNPSNDIGLIQLKDPLTYSSTVSPIKLASNSNSALWSDNKTAYVYGFGNTSTTGTEISNVLLSTDVKIINSVASSEENKIYAQGPGSKDACNLDSGGPMLASDPNTTVPTPLPLAIGIVSSNLAGGAGPGCGAGGKYTKIADYLKWIIKTIHFEGSPQYICGNTTFSNLAVLPDGATFSWSASPSSLFTTSSGTGLTFTTSDDGSAYGWGKVTLTVTLPGGTTFSKDSKAIWVGRPDNFITTTDGTFSINNGSTTLCKSIGYCLTSSALSTPPNEPQMSTAKDFTYSGWPTANSFMNYNDLTAIRDKACLGTNNTGTYFLTIYANNGTCTISRNIIVQVNDCSFRVSPNPAQNTLSLSFDSPEQLESIPDNIDLFDESKKNVKSLDMKLKKAEGIKDSKISKSLGKIDLDVRDLPRGTYYLHLTFGANREKQIEQIRVILN